MGMTDLSPPSLSQGLTDLEKVTSKVSPKEEPEDEDDRHDDDSKVNILFYLLSSGYSWITISSDPPNKRS